MSQLPKGWVDIPLEKHLEQTSTTGKKLKAKEYHVEGAYPVVDQGQGKIAGYSNDESLLVSSPKPVVVFGDHTRALKYVDFDFVPGADGTKVLVPNEYYEPKYFYYMLRTLELPDKGYSRHFKYLKECHGKVAPLAEQTRIVEKLDEVLAQVDTIKARLDGIPAILKRFRQSLLAAAVSGKLTEEWRESHNVCLTIERYKESLGSFKLKAKQLGELSEISNWLEVQLGHVIAVKSGDGLTAKKMNPTGHIPVYGGNGITGFHDTGNVGVETIVIGRVGYYCGSVHMTESLAWVTDNALMVDFPNGLLEKNFVYWLLRATNLRADDSSSAQPVISGAKIYPITVKIPPLEEQKEIVRLVDQYFAFADTIEAQVKKAQARVDKLTQSILAKAFRGELVPQDPNDEPADKLLERIATARKEAEVLAKAAKKAAKNN
ncbi:restriction endonuclease subunit S [Vibrio cholerae]|uniref:restriction endonuclease subunit S n=1 Tax=Vibrio cholerae TaxID=666 RepID=UPI00053C549E|nr:restriction endonuclease subunit S [Vibrio cholerae]